MFGCRSSFQEGLLKAIKKLVSKVLKDQKTRKVTKSFKKAYVVSKNSQKVRKLCCLSKKVVSTINILIYRLETVELF